jgi:hypothetical protein
VIGYLDIAVYEAQAVYEFECFQGLVHHLLQPVMGREGGGWVVWVDDEEMGRWSDKKVDEW